MWALNPKSFSEIHTERLYLRPILQSDFEDLCRLDGDPEVRSFFPEGALSVSQVQQELDRHLLSWQAKGFGLFTMIERATQTFVGRCGFAQLHNGAIEMGYLLLPTYWGQGYATEAALATLQWGFEHLPTDRVVGFAPILHLASLRVLEKCGMQWEYMDLYRDIPCAFYAATRPLCCRYQT